RARGSRRRRSPPPAAGAAAGARRRRREGEQRAHVSPDRAGGAAASGPAPGGDPLARDLVAAHLPYRSTRAAMAVRAGHLGPAIHQVVLLGRKPAEGGSAPRAPVQERFERHSVLLT